MKNSLFLFAILVSSFCSSQIILTPFNPNITYNHFGSALDAYGNEIVATAANSMAMTQSNVFVFEKTTSGIIQENYFTPIDGLPSDNFGSSVSINNQFIAVGSPYHDAVAANGGAVYMYQKNSATWQFLEKLTPFDGVADDYFGYDIKIYNNQLFVSSINKEAIGLPSTTNSGAVYVYNYNGLNWIFSQKLTVPNSYLFGEKIRIQNNTLAILSSSNSGTTTIHTFDFDGTNWNFSNTLNPTSNFNQLIQDFNIDNNQLFVLIKDFTNTNISIYNNASNNWVSDSTIYGLNQNDNITTNFCVKNDLMLIGANQYILQSERKSPVAIYRKTSGNWNLQEVLFGNGTPSNDDGFGSKVVITDNLIAIAANIESNPLPLGKVYTFDTALGTNTFLKDQLKILPNPTSDYLTISNNLINQIKIIEIYQNNGKLLKTISKPIENINLTNLENGIYLLSIELENGTTSFHKIIKN